MLLNLAQYLFFYMLRHQLYYYWDEDKQYKPDEGVCQIVCVTDYGVGTLPSKRMAN